MPEKVILFKFVADSTQAEARVAELKKSMDGAEDSAKRSTSAYAQAAQKQVDYGRTAAQLSKEIAENREGLLHFNSAIAQGGVRLAEMKQELLNLTSAQNVNKGAVAQLQADYRELAGDMRVLSANKRNLVADTAKLVQQFKEQSAAQAAALRAASFSTSSIKEAAGATERARAAFASLAPAIVPIEPAANNASEGFNRLTTRISVGRGALAGFDSIVEAVARSMGGLPIWFATTIGLVSILGPKLAELAGEKKENIELDKQQIALDQARLLVLGQMNAALAGSVNSGIAMNRVNADMVTSFRIVANEQVKYNTATQSLNLALKDLSEKGERVVYTAGQQDSMNKVVIAGTRTLQNQVVNYNRTLVDSEKAMQPALEGLRQLQMQFGLDEEALIRLSAQFRFNSTEQQFFRERLNEDLPALRALASEISNASNELANMERQALLTALAVQQIKPPQIDLDFLRGQFQDPNKRIERAIDSAFGGAVLGPLSDAQIFAAIRPELEAMRSEFQRTAASMASTKEETKRLYAEQVNRLIPAYQKYMNMLPVATENQKAFTDTMRQAESAAKALAQTTAQLNKELELSKVGETFDERIKKVRLEFDFRRQELARNKQLTEQNSAALTQIEEKRINKIKGESIEAEFDLRDKITQLGIENIADERQRRLAHIDFLVRKEEDRQRKIFGDEKYYASAIIDYRSALLDGFNKWENEQHRKKLIEQGRETRAHLQANLEAKLKAEEDFRRRLQAGRESRSQLEEAEQNKRRNQASAIYGDDLGEANTAMLQKRLEAIDNIRFNGLLSSFDALLDKFNLANIAAGSFSFAIQGAFQQSIAEGKNFIEVFGKLLLAGFLNALGQQAIAEGTYHMMAGAAMLFNPFTAAAGAARIAKGAALVAFGSALVAGASAIQNSLNKREATGAGAQGEGGGGSASQSQRPSTPPTQLPIPSAPRDGEREQKIIIQLDRKGTDDFLSGRKVLTVNNIGRTHASSVKPIIKGMAKG